jgi:hypothetical protein
MLFLTGTLGKFTFLQSIDMKAQDLNYSDLAVCHPNSFRAWQQSGLDLEEFLYRKCLECTVIDRGVEHPDFYCWEVRYINHEDQKCYRFGMSESKDVAMQQVIHCAFGVMELGENYLWRMDSQAADVLLDISKNAIRRSRAQEFLSKTKYKR